jgi:hypothetical protein
MKKMLLNSLSFIVCTVYAIEIYAAKKVSFAAPKGSKVYTKQAPYAGMSKKSSSNGLIKTKGVSGHMKRTSKGCTYVNPYARSK